MHSTQSEKARTRAEALFTIRQQQKVDAPVAIREYQEAQEATRSNMYRLRRQRELREAELARLHQTKPQTKP